MDQIRAKALLPIVEALAQGKTIQALHNGVWHDVSCPALNLAPEVYRIKPQPTYRPFASVDEFKPHRDKWIKTISVGGCQSRIFKVEPKGVQIIGRYVAWGVLFDEYEFEDGTPCGILKP